MEALDALAGRRRGRRPCAERMRRRVAQMACKHAGQGRRPPAHGNAGARPLCRDIIAEATARPPALTAGP